LLGEAAGEDIKFYLRPWIAVHILDEQLQLHFAEGFVLAPAVLDSVRRLQDGQAQKKITLTSQIQIFRSK
jgi:hypothetical protein